MADSCACVCGIDYPHLVPLAEPHVALRAGLAAARDRHPRLLHLVLLPLLLPLLLLVVVVVVVAVCDCLPAFVGVMRGERHYSRKVVQGRAHEALLRPHAPAAGGSKRREDTDRIQIIEGIRAVA